MGRYATGVHLVYIPFTNCKEETASVENWDEWNSRTGKAAEDGGYHASIGTYKLQRTFLTVTGPSPVAPFGFATEDNNVLYILGHCGSGERTLSATEGGESVTGDELASRVSKLIGDDKFPGGIKVYGCDSAKGFFLSLSFTHRFAKALIENHNYRSCTIYGYVECVSDYQPRYAWGGEPGDVVEFHKVVKLDSAHIKGVLLDWLPGATQTQLRRAKDVRVVVAEKGKLI